MPAAFVKVCNNYIYIPTQTRPIGIVLANKYHEALPHFMTAAPGTNRFTVLLANDQEQWHVLVRDLLAPQGVQTVSARNGREAVDILEKQPIHLAVLDAQMPQLGGVQVIKLVREHLAKTGRHCPPAILLASALTAHLQHEALGMQFFSILSKPVDPNLLLQSMARALARYHQNRWPSLS